MISSPQSIVCPRFRTDRLLVLYLSVYVVVVVVVVVIVVVVVLTLTRILKSVDTG